MSSGLALRRSRISLSFLILLSGISCKAFMSVRLQAQRMNNGSLAGAFHPAALVTASRFPQLLRLLINQAGKCA